MPKVNLSKKEYSLIKRLRSLKISNNKLYCRNSNKVVKPSVNKNKNKTRSKSLKALAKNMSKRMKLRK